MTFRRASCGRGGSAGNSPRALHHVASPRFRARHRRRDRRRCPQLCDHVHLPVQSGSTRDPARHAAHLHARRVPGKNRHDSRRAPADQRHHRRHRRLSRRDGRGLRRYAFSCSTPRNIDGVFAFQYSPRPNTSAQHMPDAIPEEEKGRRLGARAGSPARDSSASATKRLSARHLKLLVDGASRRAGQWSGRSSSNRILNFTSPQRESSGRICASASTRALAELSGRRAGRLNSREGADGRRNEDPRPDDGPRNEHAHRGAQGCAGHRGSSYLGGHLRSQRHRPRNRKSANSSPDDARSAAQCSFSVSMCACKKWWSTI